jgi:purine-nucleoside phosphorylase
VITDECFPESLQPVKLEQILAMAGKAEPQLTTIMAGVTKVLGEAIS